MLRQHFHDIWLNQTVEIQCYWDMCHSLQGYDWLFQNISEEKFQFTDIEDTDSALSLDDMHRLSSHCFISELPDA